MRRYDYYWVLFALLLLTLIGVYFLIFKKA